MRRKAKIKALIAILCFAAVVAAVGFGLYIYDSKTGNYESSEEEDYGTYVYLGDNEYEVTHHIENYLLIGSDDSGTENREGSKASSKGETYHNGMADFLMLIVIDKTDNTYGFLPINRDTIMNVPMIDENGEEGADAEEQICCARWYGKDPEQGCENTVDCVSDLLGALEIDGYYSMSMHDIGKLNHAVGGVTVTIEDDFTAKDPAMKPGTTLKLNDKQAEIFLRSRMDIGDGKNTSRMRRQEEYLKGFKEAAMKKMDEDPDFAGDLYKELQDVTVTNLPGGRVSKIANQMYKGKNLGTFNIEGKEKEGTKLNDGKVHAEFYANEESIAKALIELAGIEDRGPL